MKINYIIWRRNDAIGKVTKNQLNELKNKVEINKLILDLKPTNRLFYISATSMNILKLIKIMFSSNIIHFEEPKQIELIINYIILNKKSILTVHHLEEKKTKYDLNFFISKLIHKSFSKLIAISKKTKDDLVKYYKIDPSKIIVIYHGVDKTIFKPTSRKIGFMQNKKYILYLGSEVPRKNIENLLKAFKKISVKYPNLILLKAGYSGGEKYRENTKKLIKELDLTKKVVFISKHIPEKKLPIYYSNAELFIYPSLKEGFGMPLVEAMACGCPVVTSNLAPMNEIARNQILVNPYNYKAIIKGIDKILSNKYYKMKIKKAALKRAKDFDWEKSAKKLIRVYRELEK